MRAQTQVHGALGPVQAPALQQAPGHEPSPPTSANVCNVRSSSHRIATPRAWQWPIGPSQAPYRRAAGRWKALPSAVRGRAASSQSPRGREDPVSRWRTTRIGPYYTIDPTACSPRLTDDVRDRCPPDGITVCLGACLGRERIPNQPMIPSRTTLWLAPLLAAVSTACAVPVAFQVDLSAQQALGLFDPAVDTVLAAGTFNGGSASDFVLEPSAANPSVYVDNRRRHHGRRRRHRPVQAHREQSGRNDMGGKRGLRWRNRQPKVHAR